MPYATLGCNGMSHDTDHFSPRKSPFVQCFVLYWAQTCAEKGVPSDPKHSTKECGSHGATARGWSRQLGMVGVAVFPACGDDQSGIATGAAPGSRPVSAVS